MIPFLWLFQKRQKPAMVWDSNALAFRAFLLGLDVYVVYGSDARGPWPEDEEALSIDPAEQNAIVAGLLRRMGRQA